MYFSICHDTDLGGTKTLDIDVDYIAKNEEVAIRLGRNFPGLYVRLSTYEADELYTKLGQALHDADVQRLELAGKGVFNDGHCT